MTQHTSEQEQRELPPTRAIVLVAGSGSRMGALTGELPKSFLEIGGERLIERSLRLIRQAGIQDVTLVTGYKGSLFQDQFPQCRFVHNPKYASTNTASSLELALNDEEHGRVLVINGDVFFEEGLLRQLLNFPYPSVAAVRRGTMGCEEVKVYSNSNQLLRIGKDLSPEDCFGEAFGVYLLSPCFAESLKVTLQGIGNPKAFYEIGMDQMLGESTPMHILDIGESIGMEIDFPEDYWSLLESLGLP